MKKFLLAILLIIVIAAALLGAYFYFYPKKAQNILIPKIEQVENLKIRFAGDTAIINVELLFANNGPFKMNIDSLIYNVKFDTATLLSRAQNLNIILSPGASDTFGLPVKLPFKRLIANIKRVQDLDSVPILTDVRIVYSTIFGTKSLPHKKTTTIAVPRPPKFELEKMEYLRRDKKTLYFNAHLVMHNYGQIELNVSNLRYNIKVEDLFDASGKHSKVIKVKPKSNVREILPITVDVHRAGKILFKVATNNDQVHYKVHITADLEADKLGDDKTEIDLVKDGIMELSKK